MASFGDNSRAPFQASSLAKWFHSAPHRDFQFDDTTTIFTPSDESYRQALYMLAIFIASFGALLFLLIFVYWTYCYCSCRKPVERRRNNAKCCSKCCLQLQVFIFALICSGAVAAGFVYNSSTSDGIDDFRNSVGDIQNSINDAGSLGNQIGETLRKTRELILELLGAGKAENLTEQMIDSLSAVNSLLPQRIVNKSSEVGDIVHKFDDYRWLATVVVLVWCGFLCVLLYWTSCHFNTCILLMLALFSSLSVLFTWTLVGADFGISTGIGDFCVNPKQSIQKIASGKSSSVVSYYMDCGSFNPFIEDLSKLHRNLDAVIGLIERIPDPSTTRTEILKDLYGIRDNLSSYEDFFECEKIHKEYMNAMKSLCSKTLNSFGFLMLSFLVIGFFSGLLACCLCPLWSLRHPSPATYKYILQGPFTRAISPAVFLVLKDVIDDVGNPQDDVGNSVLWRSHEVDSQPDSSFYQTQSDERSPLIVNQDYPTYASGNQPNVEVIYAN